MHLKFIFLSLVICPCLLAQMSGGSSIQSGGGLQTTLPPLPPIQQQPFIPPEKQEQLPQIRPPQLTPQTAGYFHPGLLVFRDGKWEGRDDLLNLSNQIGVYVEVLKSPNDTMQISKEMMQKKISDIFYRGGIIPQSMGSQAQPPLPAFQVKIFLYPIERGYASFLSVRLFESVIPQRFDLGRGMAFQAITWERQSLVVDTRERIMVQLDKQVNDLASAFVELYQGFQRRKQQIYQYE